MSQNPQLWGFDRAKRRHWIVSKWRAGEGILKLLARFGRRVRQNEMRIVAMHIFVPRLIAILGSHSIESLATFGETALEYGFGGGSHLERF